MRIKPIHFLILSVCFCSTHVVAEELNPTYENETNYDKSVNFFSSIFGFFLDTRKDAYHYIYETRDGIDGFVYDVKEDYINKSKADASE